MILYFSGNGDTRWCAETIARVTNDRLLSIAEMTRRADFAISLAEGEPLAVFFPVHGWKPPRIVLDFIDSIRLNTLPSYCYAVCTCGDSIGETIALLRQALASKGIHLSSAFSVVMPETYVCLPFMYTDTLENERLKILSAQQKMEQIASTVLARTDNYEDLKKGPLPWFFTHVVGSFFNHFMITDSPFTVDRSLCTHCGKCVRVCPVANITLDTNHLPQWQCTGKCTCCMACYHHCPHHAINYGKITRSRGQYYFGIHPIGVKKQ